MMPRRPSRRFWGFRCCEGLTIPMDAHPAGVLELSLSQKYDPSRRDMEVFGSNPDPDAAPEVEDVDIQSEIASLGMR